VSCVAEVLILVKGIPDGLESAHKALHYRQTRDKLRPEGEEGGHAALELPSRAHPGDVGILVEVKGRERGARRCMRGTGGLRGHVGEESRVGIRLAEGNHAARQRAASAAAASAAAANLQNAAVNASAGDGRPLHRGRVTQTDARQVAEIIASLEAEAGRTEALSPRDARLERQARPIGACRAEHAAEIGRD
jgi:hypothetical protein